MVASRLGALSSGERFHRYDDGQIGEEVKAIRTNDSRPYSHINNNVQSLLSCRLLRCVWLVRWKIMKCICFVLVSQNKYTRAHTTTDTVVVLQTLFANIFPAFLLRTSLRYLCQIPT